MLQDRSRVKCLISIHEMPHVLYKSYSKVSSDADLDWPGPFIAIYRPLNLGLPFFYSYGAYATFTLSNYQKVKYRMLSTLEYLDFYIWEVVYCITDFQVSALG